ncbi:hypothetical protein Riv7116_0191 [Rivularia sp. PCC 7116]|uniref:hypothetical protein n=1 Tax=Rivularia sp. PCC 7116 TaxID=373994 RepID=UPI00029EFEB6|nr:hypothetical protein [Rivularia sp. PCC 7116]AFY52799.1 hypothetical protein Riv7116_0191 [Rivularia sp. PCC 7116]
MKGTFNPDLMAERLESFKAGIVSALSFSLVFILASIFNQFLLKEYFRQFYTDSVITLNWHLLISAGFAGFSGFLFGATYRYIIREDKNPHLKEGSVFAFGLARGLAQVDMGLNFSDSVFPLTVLASESITGFAIAAFTLDWAIKFGWVKPFVGSRE